MQQYQCDTDIDLPEARRTLANMWKAKYFELYKGIVSANKGIRRLRSKLDHHKKKNEELREIIAEAGLTIPSEVRRNPEAVAA